ncbi:uncharacterized protein ISCGN_013381 [Ixodes scapularis]
MSQPKTSQPAGNANESAETSNIPDEPSDSSMEDSDNEAPWNVKATKKRRHGSNSSEATIITQVSHNLTVIVKPMDPTKLITKLNPLVLKEKLDSLAPDGIIQIRPNYRLNLLALDTRNLESTKAILQLKNIGPLQVHTYEPTPASSSVGVIRGVSVEIADDDLWASIRVKSPGTQARRLGKSEVVKLIFTTGTPPDHVYVGHTRYQVLPYLEKPRQCLKCNRFGHIASTCTKAQKCSRCGADHDTSKCETQKPKCINCKKSHDATSRNCPTYKAEKQISNYKSSNNVDYSTAKSAIMSNPETDVVQHHALPKHRHGWKENLQPPVPPMSDNNYPTLDASTSRATTSSAVTSSQQSGSSRGTETTADGAASKDQQSPPKWARDRPAKKNSRPNDTPKPQSLGNAFCTIASLLRSFLTSVKSPVAQAVITIIDIITPLVAAWDN